MKDTYLSRSFRHREFICKCRRSTCSAPPMNMQFINKLQALRDLWGKALVVNSGSRCALWNIACGGTPYSQHLLGLAADLHLDNPADGPKLASLAEKVQLGGIGISLNFIHLDDGPAGRRWTYP